MRPRSVAREASAQPKVQVAPNIPPQAEKVHNQDKAKEDEEEDGLEAIIEHSSVAAAFFKDKMGFLCPATACAAALEDWDYRNMFS